MSNPTLNDLAAVSHGSDILPIIDTLSGVNELMESAQWQEAIGNGNHVFSITGALPDATWRTINNGVVPSKGTPVQKSVDLRILTSRSNTDKSLVDKARDPVQFRSNNDLMHVASVAETFAEAFIYGNGVSAIKGVASYAEELDQVIEINNPIANKESIYVVQWDSNRAYLAYPNNIDIPVEVVDIGLQNVVTDFTTGAQMSAYVTEFTMHSAFVVEDPNVVWQIQGLDPTNADQNIEEVLIDVLSALKSSAPADIYVSTRMAARLAKNAYTDSNILYSPEQVGGRRVVNFFGGHRIRRLDAIKANEAGYGGYTG